MSARLTFQASLIMVSLVAVVCAPDVEPDGTGSGSNSSVGGTTVRALVRVGSGGPQLVSAMLTREAPPEIAEGDLHVVDGDGEILATAEVPSPSIISTVPGPGEESAEVFGGGDEIIEVSAPWPEGAVAILLGEVRIETPSLIEEQVKADGMTVEPVTVLYNGPRTERIDITIVPDGYTEEELQEFQWDIDIVVEQFFDTEPYASFSQMFNIWSLPIPSNESGIGTDGEGIDTAFGCYYGCVISDGQARGLCCDSERVYQEVRAAVDSTEVILVIANAHRRVGTATDGYARVANVGSDWSVVALHELGHAFGLADEYEYESGNEYQGWGSSGPNCSRSDQGGDETLWEPFRGVDGVDSFPGCGYSNQVRPTESGCMMRTTGHYHYCPVCREHLVIAFHQYIDGPVASSEPTVDALVPVGDQGASFEVTTTDINTGQHYVLDWRVNGQVVAEDSDSFELGPCETTTGSVEVGVRLESDWIRPDHPSEALETALVWALTPGEGCEPPTPDEEGWLRVPTFIASEHPYGNGMLSWDIEAPSNTERFRIHFARVSSCDGIAFYSEPDGWLPDDIYTDCADPIRDVLGPVITGSQASLNIEAIDQVTDWGFVVDYLLVQGPEPIEPVEPEWISVAQSIESAHPYADDIEELFDVEAPADAQEMRIHFSRIDIETRYDAVEVLDGNAEVIATYDGSQDDVTTATIAGNYAIVSLRSDSSIHRWGFAIDRIEYR